MRRIMLIIVAVIAVILVIVGIGGLRKKTSPKKLPAAGEVAGFLEQAKGLKAAQPDQAIELLNKIVAEFPESPEAPQALLEVSDIYAAANQSVKQKEALKKLVDTYPSSEYAAAAQEKLWQVNIAVLFSSAQDENSISYQVKPGDTLYKIAKEHDTTVELIMKSNNLKDSLIRVGMNLKVAKTKFSVEVDKSDQKLVLKNNDQVFKIYDIAVGADNSTPVGKFRIVNRIVDPVWYRTGAIVPAGSAENILGTRWMGISEPGYGIHGTTDTKPIREQSTQGCIRMLNPQVEELYTLVPVGMEVTIND